MDQVPARPLTWRSAWRSRLGLLSRGNLGYVTTPKDRRAVSSEVPERSYLLGIYNSCIFRLRNATRQMPSISSEVSVWPSLPLPPLNP